MKVKNIMFSGFAAAILMGVAAEASAAPVAVASKGYVDSVAGKLVDLVDAAEGKTNLVDAINVKLDPVKALNDAVPEGKFYAGVAQTTDGQVSVLHKDLAISISGGVKVAPTTDAVHQAIEGVRGEIPQNVQTAIENGSTTATAGFFNKVTQTNGKVSVEEKAFDIVIDSTTGEHTDTTPSTKAVYEAMALKQNVITDGEDKTTNAGFIYEVKQDNGTVTSQIRDFDATITENTNTAPTSKAVHDALELKQNAFADGTGGSTNNGFISSVTQSGGAVTAGTTAFDEVVDSTTSDHTNTAPTTKAVYSAIQTVSQQIPDMPDACSADGVTCVLTSEGGVFAWGVLTTPVSDSTTNGLTAQSQVIEEPVTGAPSIDNPGL